MRRRPGSVQGLETLGRVRLSKNFFMRDFLYSEIANFYGIPNIPDNPDLAIAAGTRICEELLEPLQEVFGRISIRSAYRSPAVNQLGNEKGHNCATNEKNAARHIWDQRDREGCMGAMVCIVVNWYLDHYELKKDYRPLAWWIHDHLPYSSMGFFPKLCAFNISWHEKPRRSIFGFRGECLTKLGMENHQGDHREWYPGFPEWNQPQKNEEIGLRVSDFQAAFGNLYIELTSGQQKMQKAHYHAPQRVISAADLAAAAGYESYHGANRQYAAIGEKIARFLNHTPVLRQDNGRPFWSSVLAEGRYNSSNNVWYWKLRDPVVIALQPYVDA